MVRSRVAPVALFVLTACSGADKDSGDGTDTDTTEPPSVAVFVFSETVAALEFDAKLDPDAIASQQMVNTLVAATSMVVADEKVQDRLNSNGGGEFRAALECWTRPENPMFSFTLDYTGCLPYLVQGGVYVQDHPSGPLLLDFLNFTVNGRSISGTFALDTRGAWAEPLYWTAYNTDSTNPGFDNPVPLGIDLGGGQAAGLAYAGGSSVSFLSQYWAMWGVATVQPGAVPYEVVHGGDVPEDVPPETPPGASVIKTPLNWLECRCPTSGVSTYDVALEITSVSVDIDDLDLSDDEVDDPVLEFPISHIVPGKVTLDHTGCGTYETTFSGEATSIPLSEDQLLAAISYQCDILAINDPIRCRSLYDASRRAGGTTVEVSLEDLDVAAKTAVNTDFDTSWCRLY